MKTLELKPLPNVDFSGNVTGFTDIEMKRKISLEIKDDVILIRAENKSDQEIIGAGHRYNTESKISTNVMKLSKEAFESMIILYLQQEELKKIKEDNIPGELKLNTAVVYEEIKLKDKSE